VSGRRELAEPPSRASGRDAFGQRKMYVAQQREQSWPDCGHGPVLAHYRERKLQSAHVALATDPLEKAKVSREAAESDVLTVVGRRLRIALPARQRLHRATERGPRLEEDHFMAAVDEVESGREPSEAAADDDDFHSAATARTFSTPDS
jgi:hypothetical protein